MSAVVERFYSLARTLRMEDTMMYLDSADSLRISSREGDASSNGLLRAVDRDQREIHKSTWRVFSSALKEYLGEGVYDSICRKYNLNVQQYLEDGTPLTAKHVTMFGVGAADISTKRIKSGAEDKLSQLTTEQIRERCQQENPVRYIGPEATPQSLYGYPSQNRAYFVYDPFLDDLERLLLLQGMDQIQEKRAFYERFAKAIASREFGEKTIIPAPDFQGGVDYYKVYKKISNGSGLVAYALKPISAQSSLPPLIVFRSTALHPAAVDAIETWYDDLSPNIGDRGYNASKEKLEHLTNDPKFCPPGKKIEAVGFSLGGSHAQLYVKDHFQKVKNAYFFNDPGISAEAADRFAETMNAIPPESYPDLTLHIYRTKGDVIHFGGSKHLGFNVQDPRVVKMTEIVPGSERPLSYRQLHNTRFFDSPDISFTERVIEGEELQRELNNVERGTFAVWIERVRWFFGYFIVTPFIWVFTHIVNFFAWVFGFEFLRNSDSGEQV